MPLPFCTAIVVELEATSETGNDFGNILKIKAFQKKNVKSSVKSQHSVSRFCHLTFFFKLIYHFLQKLWRSTPRMTVGLTQINTFVKNIVKSLKKIVKSQHSVSRFCHLTRFFYCFFLSFFYRNCGGAWSCRDRERFWGLLWRTHERHQSLSENKGRCHSRLVWPQLWSFKGSLNYFTNIIENFIHSISIAVLDFALLS